jgi:hypothetical protein
MNINEFYNKFPKCPKCNSNFVDDVLIVAEYPNFPFPIKKTIAGQNEFKIAFQDPISNNDKRIDFSVNYNNGEVKLYNTTKKSDLDKFEDLSLTIEIGCSFCGIEETSGFRVGYFGVYEPSKCAFENFGILFFEFTYALDSTYYIFNNDYQANYSNLHVNYLNKGKKIDLNNIPFVSIDVFDFSDENKIRQKLNNIMILS